MKRLLIVSLVIGLFFVITPIISSVGAGSVELSETAKAGTVTIEFSGKTTKAVQKELVEEKLMFFPIPEGGMGGVIWIGNRYAGSFYLKDDNLVGHRGAIDYLYGDANTLYETNRYEVIAFYAGKMGIAIKLYLK